MPKGGWSHYWKIKKSLTKPDLPEWLRRRYLKEVKKYQELMKKNQLEAKS